MIEGLDPGRALGGLKDFQRRTVDYVFRRMFLDDPPATRFLVADEVGLGKTMVARGIIARTLDHLQHSVERLDVIYVCSNSAIASQNINKLNVLGSRGFSYASRLTLLPLELRELERHRVNFISFTPGTTFNLHSSGGRKEERALLFRLLTDAEIGRPEPLIEALRCTAGLDSFRRLAHDRSRPISEALALSFIDRLRAAPELLARVEELCDRAPAGAGEWQGESWTFRYQTIGKLRELLARVCVDELQPDLVILDEFQRFKDLLEPNTEAGQLAHDLMNHVTPEGHDVRVLLLSATPYRSYTMDHEGEDHYRDFLHTARFLLRDEDATVALDRELRELRSALYAVGDDASYDRLAGAQSALQRRLLSVMVRTERIAWTQELDGMLDARVLDASLEPRDLEQIKLVDGIARTVGAGDAIEYWKSSPYLLNFMKEYELKRKLVQHGARPHPTLAGLVRSHREGLLRSGHVHAYKPVAFDNGRLRTLVRDMIDGGGWRVLWLPPSLPYLEPAGAFADVAGLTKALVFSSWNVVPDAIAGLCSYEVERRILSNDPDRPEYRALLKKRRGLLRFALTPEGEPRHMTTLLALYPSPALAALADPLRWALEAGAPLPLPEARARAAAVIEARLAETGAWPPARRIGLPDPRWYWAAVALLDRAGGRELVEWCDRVWVRSGVGAPSPAPATGGPPPGGRAGAGAAEEGDDGAFPAHVDRWVVALRDPESTLAELGDPPDDLVQVLGDLALAGPAVCALRALTRVAGPDAPAGAVWSAAARVAEGFRSLYNLPQSMALLRAGDEGAYWQTILRHGLEGNLQAVLDEYAHVLAEWLGVKGHSPERVAGDVARGMEEALSLQTGRVEPDEIRAKRDNRVIPDRFWLRCRFALRFTELRDDAGTLARVDTVRKAFNSPFWPFILATTSVGQEGLDFHPYCHVVYHWNLPPSPVDMEQREGRVHRYKGHAVRKNIAQRFGLAGAAPTGTGPLEGGRLDPAAEAGADHAIVAAFAFMLPEAAPPETELPDAARPAVRLRDHAIDHDPWQALFDNAQAQRDDGRNDLYPYWLFPLENGARIERRVPLPPLSRERGRYERLRRSLAIYRMVFGQPRQEDLLAHLRGKVTDESQVERLCRYQIRLEPPANAAGSSSEDAMPDQSMPNPT